MTPKEEQCGSCGCISRTDETHACPGRVRALLTSLTLERVQRSLDTDERKGLRSELDEAKAEIERLRSIAAELEAERDDAWARGPAR